MGPFLPSHNFSATHFGSNCYGAREDLNKRASEDCLNLNIYVSTKALQDRFVLNFSLSGHVRTIVVLFLAIGLVTNIITMFAKRFRRNQSHFRFYFIFMVVRFLLEIIPRMVFNSTLDRIVLSAVYRSLFSWSHENLDLFSIETDKRVF